VVEEDEPARDDLEASYVLSERGLEAFRHEIAGAASADARPAEVAEAYENNRAFLLDLRILHNLHQQRAQRLFHADRWNRLHHRSLPGEATLDAQILAGWQRVEARLEATERAAQFPAIRLMREYHLERHEVVLVVHLLFKELFEGNAYADVAELLKLVSRDESELIQNRRLVAESAPLRKAEILKIEPMLEGRDLTAEAYLNDWVINFAFGATTPDESIHADERIDWHVYLEQMDDTHGFFRDLDTN
jgi:hypothetical protein